jgi:amino acid adenylation domain-containing protein
MQTLFWRMQTADPSSRDFLVVTGFRFSGSLQVDLLRKSFETVVAAQPALRTVFIERDGELSQRILPEMPLAWERVELPSLETPNEIEGLRTLFRDIRSQPFDLGQGPLMRVRLLCKGPQDHLLQIAIHHTVSDGTSMTLLLDAVSEVYNGLLQGTDTHIGQSPDANGRFAVQERKWLAVEDEAQSLQYWIRRLQKRGLLHPWPSWSGVPELPKRKTGPSGVFEWNLDQTLSEGVGRLATLLQTSRFRVLLGTYLLTLQRMLPGRPVTVGVAMDMRRLLNDKTSMGCLINMLPVTVDGESSEVMMEYLKNAAREVEEAIEHARVPYPDMLEAWMKEEHNLRTAKWKTLFNLKDTESGRLALEGCTCEKVHEHLNEVLQDDRSSDLSITMTRTPGEKGDRPIRMLIRYDEDILSRQQVEAIIESWESALRQCIADPKAEVDSIALPGIIGKYADWQKRLASPGTRERLETYWKHRLSDLTEPATLMPDLTSKNETSGRRGSWTIRLEASIHTRMDDYCRLEGLSRYAAWMSIWQILQARLGNGDDVLMSVPVTEPGNPVLNGTSDAYLNLLPIHTKIEGKDSFRTFNRSNQDSLVRDLVHSQLPYEDIVRMANGDLGADGQGMNQVMFVWHGDCEWSEEDDFSVDISPKASYAKNPITVHLTDHGDVCRMSMEYDADLFHEQTAQSILQRFETVARQVLVNPDTRIGEIDILLPGERERLHELSGRNHVVDYPETTLHAIFRQTAERYPDRPAVIEPDGRVTSYSELREQVDKVTAFLRAQGIEREAVAAVHMNRSPELLASILGIMEAGGAFLLMEPSLPLDRLRTMAEQARVAAVITEGDMPLIPGFSGCTHRFDDILNADLAEEHVIDPSSDPASSACVIFTSGSTGVPKGAMLGHGNLLNYLGEIKGTYSFGSEDRTLQKTLLSFDACVIEWFLPGFTGGAVVLPSPDLLNDMQALADLVERQRVSYLFFAPSQLSLFLQTKDIRKVDTSLRTITCGGEALQDPLVSKCLGTLNVQLFNGYGPVEAALSVAQWQCHIDHAHPKPPIGRPNTNVDILVMDAKGRPVPPGMPGELWIGGAQTGRGYINNEEETKKRFVVDPLEPGSGRRYYKTGDFARFLSDGNLLFLGRKDEQLKIRGVRIELGDVTAALTKCEGVREAVVLAEPDGEGSNRLRAWVTVDDEVEVNESSIRSSMNGFLPGYMVPFRIHVTEAIPLTPHGKTDQRALRAMAENDTEGAEGLPLNTSTVQRLAVIWSELLGVEVQYRDADFFRLGGHSLIAMRMSAHLQKEFGVTASLPDFYIDGRLDRLAERIDAGQDKGSEVPRLSDMPTLLPGERVPMSGSQRRMWMLQQLLTNPSSYHIARVFPIPRERSATEVRSILTTMAERHGILRTRLFQDDDGFWQEELPQDGWNMDWGELEAATPEKCFELLSGERERTFDLSKESGWRARWVQEQGREPRLLLVFHHALMDEWSMNLFGKEFVALLTGKTSVEGLTKPAHGYIEFSRWQHWTFSQGLRERLETYWKGRLSDLGEPVRLSADLVPRDGTAGRSDTVGRPVESTTRSLMEAYSRSEGLSRFAVWMAVWQILHSRLGSGEEVVLATPVSERDRSEWQDVMGMCLNTLPIRMKVDEDASFRSFSKKSHQSLASDLAHVQLPYEDIVRLADGDLGTDGQGLPQVMFTWHGEYEWSEEDGSDPGSPSKRSHATNPLSIHIADRSNACRISIVYDDGLFMEQTAEKILLRYEAVARQVLENPDMRICDIDILLPGERERLYELSGSDCVAAYPETTLHEIFRKTAERHPDRPAVIEADGRETSYAELQEQVSRVAAFLRSKGIGKEAVVALHMQRSPLLLASTLGVLEAGGAFLLLEPSLPLERLRVMADQAQVAALISKQDMDILAGFEERTYMVDDVFSHDVSCGTDKDESNRASLAYVLFTSGSTGTPKGVMIEHSNLVGYLESIRQSYSFGPNHRTLMRTPVSFDACLIELLLPLCTGGGMVLAEPGTENDMQAMTDLIESRGVSHLFCVPTLLRYLMEVGDLVKIKGVLKTIVSGGESFHEILMRGCKDALEVEVFQDYGPTEATVAVTFWRYEPHHGHASPPIGKPNAGVTVLVMDELGRQLPPGMPGELWIGGAQTARGYINNEEETRKRFVDDPIDPGSGRRYYRTGDLVRFLPDGNLLFHGRMDDQLKVRGVRIELGDVTASLLRCHGVREAVVLAEPDGEGSNRLRGWVTVKEDFEGDESSIRSSMTELLPGYMVPFRIHFIASIPLTSNGKTDHRALRVLAEQAGDEAEGLPLITSTEQRLAAIWSELLGVEVLRRDTDFFRLGGHSLIAMRLAGRIRKEFGLTVSLPDFYRDGRLDRLATRIDAKGDEGDIIKQLSNMPALLPGERVPMSGSQRRMWMLQQLLSNPSSYHIAHVFAMPRERSATEVKSILTSMAARHGILRTRLFQQDDGFWQEELPIDEWRIDWTELNAASEEECIELLSEARERIFDLSHSPGWRARWMTQNDREPFLLLVFHHALVDEWSMNLFMKEFDALLTGRSSVEELTKPAHSYLDFSRWQHWSFSQGLRERLDAYWTERLSDLGEPVRLSADLVPRDGTAGRSATVGRPVESSTHRLMEAYCRSEGLSRFAVWMAVWQILHSRLGSGEEVVIATPVSERDRPEWQDVMGMCLNTLPIRSKVDEDASFRSFSRKSHQSLTGDLEHGQLPYEDIVPLADGDLGTDGQGLPQVMFVWHGEYDWSGDDGSESVYPWKRSRAKNPISIHITDRSSACRISIVYDDGVFEERTVEKILLRYEAVARQLLDNPDIRIADIDILLPGEREHILELSGRDNKVEYPKTSLHGIFRQTAECHPDRPAVIEADGRETSYAELQAQVLKIASFLRSHGIEKESVVAVHMQRSSKLMASMLGVMEAGCAFLLMEPCLPLDRLRSKADQARVSILITDEGMPVLPDFSDRTHTIDDILSAEGSEQTIHGTQTDSTSLACVIFTSGSTGVPKGAMLEHGNLLNYLCEIKEAYSFDSDARTLQKTLLSFDASLIELLLPMTIGGSVVMPEPGVEADMRRLSVLAEVHRVNYVFFAPAQLRLFLEVPGIERLNGSLKVVACGGESVSDSLVAAHLETLKVSLYQIYGPTETSIAVAQWNCRSGHGYPKPPLGRPNANVDILIMDAHGRPVPPGMPGELWIGGAQTGRGYINNEEETIRRFVVDPLEAGSGRRYYRTGDLAKFLADGNLLFLGRMDDQQKVRGVRIELGDVTAALLRCNGVREAVVLAEPDGEGSNRLRAWVTLKEGVDESESTIRTSLMELLPGYMIPFRIHVMDSVPLTTHGKTDHRALRAMTEDGTAEREVLPINTITEHRLAAIWADLLGVDVGRRDDDFFRLGGHSLLVIRLLDGIKSSWGVRPDISAVFMNSSLESMARSIDMSIEPLQSKVLDVPVAPVKVWDKGKGRHVFAFVGGAGNEEEFTKYHLIGRELGEGWRIHILPDPETSKGRFPTIGLDRLADMYAKVLIPYCREERVWLVGDCIGGQDAFAVASALQSAGVAKPGLLLMDTPVPAPGKGRLVKDAEGLESYRKFPESAGPFREVLFRSFLWLARFKPLRSLFHLRPRSRGQVLAMAVEYGLFDPVDYSLRCPGSGRSSEEAFHHYLTEGRLKGEPPSGRFNGYRYAKHVDGFDIQGDDPVLHALLVGFRERYPRRRVLAYVERPNMKSDLMSARRELRSAYDVPAKFEGQVHVIVSSEFKRDGRSPGWQRHVEGPVQVHRVEGDHGSYLKERLADTAKTIGRILDGDG